MLFNIIDKIYENPHFTTFLVAAILLLLVLFIIIYIMGLRDAKKALEPEVEEEKEVDDISFDNIEKMEINEDVTFEMPSLTSNLEDFKKSLEEEIAKDDKEDIQPERRERRNKEMSKPVKILDIKEIEDTLTMDKILIDEDEKSE